MAVSPDGKSVYSTTHSAVARFKRNLKTGEILGQVAVVMEEGPREPLPWNVVVMGMGEPLLNYEATVSALRVLMDPEGFAVAPRKLTLSTVGILPALEKLMQEPVRPNLAISLHAPNQALRRVLMPIEEKYALADVMAAALRYPIPRGGLVTFEYVLLRGVNDRPAHARELVRRLVNSIRRARSVSVPIVFAPALHAFFSVAAYVAVGRAEQTASRATAATRFATGSASGGPGAATAPSPRS